LYVVSVNALNFMILLEMLSSNFEFIHHHVLLGNFMVLMVINKIIKT